MSPSAATEETPADVNEAIAGTVLDAATARPIPNATIFHDGQTVHSGADGGFQLVHAKRALPVLVKASGYRHKSASIRQEAALEIALEPLVIEGLYLTYYGISSSVLRGRVFDLIESTELNSVVIDVKGDLGLLSYSYDVPLARECGADKMPTIRDIRALLADLHSRGIYVIGRIVCFKDNVLANCKPELAIMDTRTQRPWTDNERLAWVDPFRNEVWDYNIIIAKAAAEVGFDEIQFDYIRFPTDGRLSAARYSQANNEKSRVKAIDTFLEAAHQALLPYNVYLSVDVFGYVPWNYDDTGVGQIIGNLAEHVDYLCLMEYPSGFHLGIPGFRNPVANPREVVYYTLEQAKRRLQGQQEKLRPWLQSFRDYAFDQRVYAGPEIALQILGCKQAGASGFMLWDPTNRFGYAADAMSIVRQAEATAATKRSTKNTGAAMHGDDAPVPAGSGAAPK